MIIQIYEIQTPREAETCAQLGVDHIGCVLFSGRKATQTELREAIRVSRAAGIRSSLLPLFEDKYQVYRAIEHYAPDYVHFCQNLTEPNGTPTGLEQFVSLQAGIKESFPEIGIIRSIPLPRKGLEGANFPLLELVHALEGVSDFFLIDTWTEREPVKGFIGITGMVSDWGMAKEVVLASPIPVILAGGISPGNAYEAILGVIPAGIDSCTRTNKCDADGRPLRFQKDFAKVKELVEEVRRAEKALGALKEETEKALMILKEEPRGREAVFRAYSVRPDRVSGMERLEEEIARMRKELRCLQLAISKGR